MNVQRRCGESSVAGVALGRSAAGCRPPWFLVLREASAGSLKFRTEIESGTTFSSTSDHRRLRQLHGPILVSLSFALSCDATSEPQQRLRRFRRPSPRCTNAQAGYRLSKWSLASCFGGFLKRQLLTRGFSFSQCERLSRCLSPSSSRTTRTSRKLPNFRTASTVRYSDIFPAATR